jgi:hypothetical protein
VELARQALSRCTRRNLGEDEFEQVARLRSLLEADEERHAACSAWADGILDAEYDPLEPGVAPAEPEAVPTPGTPEPSDDKLADRLAKRYRGLGSRLRSPHPDRPTFVTDLTHALAAVRAAPDIPPTAALAARLIAEAVSAEGDFKQRLRDYVRRDRALVESSAEYLPVFAALIASPADLRLLLERANRSYPTGWHALPLARGVISRIAEVFWTAMRSRQATPQPAPEASVATPEEATPQPRHAEVIASADQSAGLNCNAPPGEALQSSTVTNQQTTEATAAIGRTPASPATGAGPGNTGTTNDNAPGPDEFNFGAGRIADGFTRQDLLILHAVSHAGREGVRMDKLAEMLDQKKGEKGIKATEAAIRRLNNRLSETAKHKTHINFRVDVVNKVAVLKELV